MAVYTFHYLSLAFAAAFEGTLKYLLAEFLSQTPTAQKIVKRKHMTEYFRLLCNDREGYSDALLFKTEFSSYFSQVR